MSTKRSPKLRPAPWDALVVLAVLALAAGSLLTLARSGETENLTAVVIIDGQETDRFPVADLLNGARTYTSNGVTLEICAGIKDLGSGLDAQSSGGTRGVRAALSDCPTQDCVRTGIITRSGQSIVCLPARLILRLEGGQPETGGPDIIIG